MGSIIVLVANLVAIAALGISIGRFWSDGRLGAKSTRRLASLGATLTLLVALIIYSGEFERVALSALGNLGASEHLYNGVHTFLSHLDRFFTNVANAVNKALDAERVGYRPYPPAWPAIVLAAGYSIRFLIYRSHTKKGNTDAALTGSVYWSHITTYTMVMAFLIVIVGVNPWLLVPLSLVALGAIVVSVKLIAEDLGVLARATAGTIWTTLVNAARRIAYLATELAAALREFLAYASKVYIKNVREPLRRRVDSLDKRNEAVRARSTAKLTEQDRRLRARFRKGIDEDLATAVQPSPSASSKSPTERSGGSTWYDPESASGRDRQDVSVIEASATQGRESDVATVADSPSVQREDDLSVVANALWRAVASSRVAVNLATYETWRTSTAPYAPSGIEVERRFGDFGRLNGLIRNMQATPGKTASDLEQILGVREKRS